MGERKRWLITSIFILLILIIISSILWQKNQSAHNDIRLSLSTTPSITSSTEITPSSETANIIVTSPIKMSTVMLPVTVQGKARVFENQFNYRILDVNKDVIDEGKAYANSQEQGQYGNFSIMINSLPTMRANAITVEVFDYSAKDGKEIDTVSIPLIYDPANSIPVNVYLSRKNAPAGQDCTKVFPVEHHVMKTSQTARAALEELLKGPVTMEKNNGYYSGINEGVKIQKLTIVNGTAKVDFNSQLETGIAGSCKVSAIRAQISETLKQFPSVKEVVISINGNTEGILQP
jgi:hypothetical protein